MAPAAELPFKMWLARSDGTIVPAATCELREAHSLPRQVLPQAYKTNGCVGVVRSRTILELNSMAGECVGALMMADSYDIDTPEQMERAAAAFARLR